MDSYGRESAVSLKKYCESHLVHRCGINQVPVQWANRMLDIYSVGKHRQTRSLQVCLEGKNAR